MGQRVLSIDLGARRVKVAELEVGFKKTRLQRLQQIEVLPGPEPALARSLVALAEELERTDELDTILVSMPGDRVLLRLLELPVLDPRKLGPLVGNELADQLPWELEDIVFDHVSLLAAPGRVLAAAVRSAEVQQLLEQLAEIQIDPRALVVPSLSYAPLVRRLDSTSSALVVDIGHLRTNVCLVHQGRAVSARTISRGGHQLSETFQQVFQLGYAEAEMLKEQQALVPAGDPAELPPAVRPYAEVTLQAVRPLVRDLRLTQGIFVGALGIRPGILYLCGGGAQLEGLDSHLASELGMLVEPLHLEPGDDLQGIEDLGPEEGAGGALALGMALAHGGRHELNLRQGEYACRHDSSVLKDKLLSIAISVAAVLFFAAFSAYLTYYSLSQEQQGLTSQLERASKLVFGEAIAEPTKISNQVKLGARATSSGIPQKTVFDVLQLLSTRIPGKDKIKLDITRLDVKQGKTYITGTADSRSAVGDIVKELEADPCFSEVSAGKISDVADGKKQFSLNIKTDCF